MSNEVRLGSKLGPRVARLASDAITHHLQQSSNTRAKIGTKAALDLFKVISGKVHRTVGPHALKLADAEGMPEWAATTLRFVGAESGEWQSLLASSVYGSGLGSSITAVIVNEIAPAVQGLLAKDPNALLPPAAAADAYAKGLLTHGQASGEAARSALNGDRFDVIAAAVQAFPDLGSLLELHRRGHLDDAGVVAYLRRQNYPEGIAHLLLELRDQLLTPADLALMVVKGILDEQTGRQLAHHAGVPAVDFDRLVLATGEPPGPEELMFALRRGFIDGQRFDHGIRQSRIRNEWLDVLHKLRFSPMATADAVMAVVQNHLTDREGRAIAEQNGLEAAHWQPLVETHGRPPGPDQMLSLLNRGEVTAARVEQAIRESDVKNKYIPELLKLRRRLPPERTVVSMMRHGVITHEQGIAHLVALGFDHQDAAAFAKEASAQKTAVDKDLAKGDVLNLFEEQVIDQARAEKLLGALGYSAQEAGYLLALAGARRTRRFHEAAVTRVRALYGGWHIDERAASGLLDQLGVAAPQRDRLLALWRLEHDANVRHLTEAQVIKAMKKAQLTEQEAYNRLRGMGYTDADARILIADA